MPIYLALVLDIYFNRKVLTMNRRQFITNSILIAAGTKLFAQSLANNSISNPNQQKNFNLEIISDNPELAYTEMNRFINKYFIGRVNSSEYQMNGKYIADIVVTQSNSLLNFYDDKSDFSSELRKIATKLSAKKSVNNPTLISFSSADYQQAKYFDVFIDNKLMERIPTTESHKDLKFTTKKGELYLCTDNSKATISESSCKHRTCVAHNSISKSGSSIVCIPNKFRISASGNNRNGIDAITY